MPNKRIFLWDLANFKKKDDKAGDKGDKGGDKKDD